MSDQNKQQNNTQEIQNNRSEFSVSDVSVFHNSPSQLYLYKKTERLVSAIYLLSGIISDKEPIKWQMREAGLEMIAQSLSMSDRNGLVATSLNLISFLEISHLSQLISEMNYQVLKQEFEGLIQTAQVEEKRNNPRSISFPENFLTVAEPAPAQENTNVLYKGQNTMSDRVSFKKPAESVRSGEQKQKDKTNRQDLILALLKKGNDLGIKDFTTSIKDCSEKTIQRELASLISKGLIKKEGEKRWSKYSIKG